MIIHQPGEAPDFRTRDFTPGTGGNYKYKLTPQLTVGEETLKYVGVKQRKCYFSSEKHLRFYRTYTYKNCLLDCLANITLQECICLPEYLPGK